MRYIAGTGCAVDFVFWYETGTPGVEDGYRSTEAGGSVVTENKNLPDNNIESGSLWEWNDCD